MTDSVGETLDHACGDGSVSADAMRWAPVIDANEPPGKAARLRAQLIESLSRHPIARETRVSQVQICPVDHRIDAARPRRVPEGSQVCGGCIERARRSVRDLPALHDDLGDVLGGVKRAGGAGPVTGSSETPLPINPAIAEHRALIRSVVISWCVTVSDTMPATLPTTPDLNVACPWLLRYIDWACRQEWAGNFVTEVRHLAGRARGLIDPQEQSNIRLGPCVEDTPAEDGTLVPCGGELWGTFREDDPRPWLIECSECGKEWISEMWLRLGHLIQQRKTKETAS